MIHYQTPPISTPTPVYWATPTVIPTAASTPQLDLGGVETVYTLAENLVQGYNMAESYGALDMLYWVLLGAVVMSGIWSIVKRIKAL
jgi:hypothetical protein